MKPYLIVAFTLALIAGFGFSLAETTLSHEAPALSPSHEHHLLISSEEQFMVDMIPHHQEAIDSARLMSDSENEDVRALASRIVNAQEDEIAFMRTLQKSDSNMNTRYTPMMPDLTRLEGVERDRVFLEGMIAHHEMAIDMTRQMLSANPREEFKSLGTSIIEIQSVEIDEMRSILKSRAI